MQIKSFFTILLCFFGLIANAQLKNDTKSFVVVLDAGHGGKDPGRPTSYGYKEKDIALFSILTPCAKLANNGYVRECVIAFMPVKGASCGVK